VSTDLAGRLDALAGAVRGAEGRLDGPAINAARTLVARAGERLKLSGEHTVVALAGATGSGKSSLFNALVGLDLSAVGVRRPTTNTALACVWGGEGAAPLLDWLGVPRRHQISRDSELDVPAQDDLDGLVLLDLPDFDSTSVEHRVEVDRLIALVDLFVWVVDPQKYADNVLHQLYLRRLNRHDEVMLMVLNKVDMLDVDGETACVADLRRLLIEDGLQSVPVLPMSARTGRGIADLRAVLADKVGARAAYVGRVRADLDVSAAQLLGLHDKRSDRGSSVREVSRAGTDRLVDALSEAAGVPVVASAVARSYRYQAAGETGWPFTRWLRRLRPDPLRRLHLGTAARDAIAAAPARTSLPPATPVQRSQVDIAVREIAVTAAAGLPEGWAASVRAAASSAREDLSDELDKAIATAELGELRRPLWWRAVAGLQWLLAIAAVLGLGWLLVLFALSYFRLPEPGVPSVGELPLPTLLAIGGVLGGLILALISRWIAAFGARRRRRRVTRVLRRRIADVAERLVLTPVREELKTYAETGELLQRAAGR
jgi:GTP-binding protein EngB required for normal cell division